jgi:hypothetical protein
MLPMMLAKRILDLDESELIKVLSNLESEDLDAFNLLVEVIQDL